MRRELRLREKESMKKIAVLFPGIGYTCDKPLLYYSGKAAAEKGYEIVRVPYGNFPPNVKGDAAKMQQCFVSAREQTEELLKGVDWTGYNDIVFFSKSVGTVVALSYAAEHGIDARQVLYTPLAETFRFPVPTEGAGAEIREEDGITAAVRAVAFHGTADPWARTEEIVRICGEKNIPLFLTENANHSLECGRALKDLKTVRKVIKTVKKIL